MSTLQPGRSPQQAQLSAIHRLRGEVVEATDATTSAGSYAGLVTRVLAFALDALIIDGVAALVGVTVGLGLSLLPLVGMVAVAGGLGYLFWDSAINTVFVWLESSEWLASAHASL